MGMTSGELFRLPDSEHHIVHQEAPLIIVDVGISEEPVMRIIEMEDEVSIIDDSFVGPVAAVFKIP